MVETNSIYYKEEHILLRKMVRDFAKNELAPIAQQIDSESQFPKESIAKLSELGLMGIPWDTKYGGGGMDTLSLVIVIEEIAKVCVSTAATLMAHTSLGTGPFYYFGTEDQKEKYLKPLLEGKIRSAFAMTEPAVASSDATNIESEIKMEGNQYVINGTKWWTSGAMDPRCEFYIFMGKTDPDNENIHKQQSMILVDKDTPGINIKRHLPVFGYDDAPGYAPISIYGI